MAGIGIIGLGRVGRRLLREMHARGLTALVKAVSEIAPPGRPVAEAATDLAYLLKFDTLAGTMQAQVGVSRRGLLLDGHEIALVLEAHPGRVDWAGLGVNLLVEASGDAIAAAQARALVGSRVAKLVITRSESEADAILARGVNLDSYDPASHHVVSCSTCTANALAPLLKIIDDAYGIAAGALTSVHPALSGDTLLDSPACQGAKGRSGLTVRAVTSEMARTVPRLLPGLKGRLTAMSLRVPTLVVNALVADLTLERPPQGEGEVKELLQEAAQGPLAGVLALTEGFLGRSLAAADFEGDPHSAVADLGWLAVNGPMLRLLIWHDNEHAYCCRVADTIEMMLKGLD